MSNNPLGQSVKPRNEYDSYPTTTMHTVVGNIQVADKSYGIQGQVVDSTGDRPIDVNAVAGVQMPAEGMKMPETGMLQELEGHETEGPTERILENPEQTFAPNSERKRGQ
jgi:hypothetical protein